MEALDEVCREVWCEAYSEAVRLAKEHPRKKGRPKADDSESAIVRAAKAKAEEIKNSAYALGKAPEHLTENQQAKVAMIAGNNNRLYRAYRMKEMLRLLLKIKDVVRKAYGFRNIQNMLDMVYLVCSDLKVPLSNRKPKAV